MNKETGIRIPEEVPETSSPPAAAEKAGSYAGGGAGMMKIPTGVAAAFRSGKDKSQIEDSPGGKVDTGTQLAHERTDLAVNRSYLAIERTLMAWIRTSLSMISFGFTIGKLGQILNDLQLKGPLGRTRTVSVEELAHFLVILGTVALIGAAFQHRIRMRELYAMGLRHQLSITFIVAVVLISLGGFALGSLILAL